MVQLSPAAPTSFPIGAAQPNGLRFSRPENTRGPDGNQDGEETQD
jgi:hypothetical protein